MMKGKRGRGERDKMSSPGKKKKVPLPFKRKKEGKGKEMSEKKIVPFSHTEKKEGLPVVHLAEFIFIDRIRLYKRNEPANGRCYDSITERSEILLL